MQDVALSMQKRSANTLKMLDFLYQMPVIDISSAAKELNVSFPTASNLIHDLVSLGILTQFKKISRSQTFVFSKYMEIFMDPPFANKKEQSDD